LSSEICK